MHGPLLARNPRLADVLLALATGTTPTALDDDEETALHAERLAALSVGGRTVADGRGTVARWRSLVHLRRS
jgi:hypothetical protein